MPTHKNIHTNMCTYTQADLYKEFDEIDGITSSKSVPKPKTNSKRRNHIVMSKNAPADHTHTKIPAQQPRTRAKRDRTLLDDHVQDDMPETAGDKSDSEPESYMQDIDSDNYHKSKNDPGYRGKDDSYKNNQEETLQGPSNDVSGYDDDNIEAAGDHDLDDAEELMNQEEEDSEAYDSEGWKARGGGSEFWVDEHGKKHRELYIVFGFGRV
jgi:hypothetical protein